MRKNLSQKRTSITMAVNHNNHFAQKRSKSKNNSHRKKPKSALLSEQHQSTMASSSVTYSATLDSNSGGMVQTRRIRSPVQHDVLSGRGGNVNAHPGNIQFRDWVSVRKEDYNLARSKQDKAEICREVVAQVLDLGGRFLAKESPSSQWWIELDDERIMAKTSQALREGAPKIREAHREELGVVPRATLNHAQSGKETRGSRTLHGVAAEPAVADKSRDTTFEPSALPDATLGSNNKRLRVDDKGFTVLPNQQTPPLSSMPAPQEPTEQQLILEQDNQLMPAPHMFPPPPPRRFSALLNHTHSSNSFQQQQSHHQQQPNHLARSNSLAMSDFSVSPEDLQGDFINPFEDESELLGRKHSSSSLHSSRSMTLGLVPPPLPPPLRPGVWRDSSAASSSGGSSDMAGLGALLRSESSHSVNNNNINNNNNTSLNYYNNASPRSAFFRSADNSSSKAKTDGAVRVNNRSSSSSLSSRYDDTYRNSDFYSGNGAGASIGSQDTLGMPLWEWLGEEVDMIPVPQ